ncbi:collagen alpha-2(I) chain-like [Myiozetetes cayanensis]|uniref:collagen alpha-2(I) chain-like n=1 Tax=Myiozetetes cayanensis TaxID=478635 RepID=UPI00215ECC41|nr:collagen alpha-2(I) chain-like [Myiozetetes cayanensis]
MLPQRRCRQERDAAGGRPVLVPAGTLARPGRARERRGHARTSEERCGGSRCGFRARRGVPAPLPGARSSPALPAGSLRQEAGAAGTEPGLLLAGGARAGVPGGERGRPPVQGAGLGAAPVRARPGRGAGAVPLRWVPVRGPGAPVRGPGGTGVSAPPARGGPADKARGRPAQRMLRAGAGPPGSPGGTMSRARRDLRRPPPATPGCPLRRAPRTCCSARSRDTAPTREPCPLGAEQSAPAPHLTEVSPSRCRDTLALSRQVTLRRKAADTHNLSAPRYPGEAPRTGVPGHSPPSSPIAIPAHVEIHAPVAIGSPVAIATQVPPVREEPIPAQPDIPAPPDRARPRGTSRRRCRSRCRSGRDRLSPEPAPRGRGQAPPRPIVACRGRGGGAGPPAGHPHCPHRVPAATGTFSQREPASHRHRLRSRPAWDVPTPRRAGPSPRHPLGPSTPPKVQQGQEGPRRRRRAGPGGPPGPPNLHHRVRPPHGHHGCTLQHHSCQTSSTIHRTASTCPRPASSHHGSCHRSSRHRHCHRHVPTGTRHPPAGHGASPQGHRGDVLAPNHARAEERCPGARGDTAGAPSRLAGASPSCRQPGPADVAPGSGARSHPCAMPEAPRLRSGTSTVLSPLTCRRPRHRPQQEPVGSTCAPRRPGRQAPREGAGPGAGPPAAAGAPGDTQHRLCRTPRTQKSTSTLWERGAAAPAGQGGSAEALPFGTEKGYCMTQDGDASARPPRPCRSLGKARHSEAQPPGAGAAGRWSRRALPGPGRRALGADGAGLGAERVSFASASLPAGLSHCRFPSSESGAGDGVSSRPLLREAETKPTGKPSQKRAEN